MDKFSDMKHKKRVRYSKSRRPRKPRRPRRPLIHPKNITMRRHPKSRIPHRLPRSRRYLNKTSGLSRWFSDKWIDVWEILDFVISSSSSIAFFIMFN